MTKAANPVRGYVLCPVCQSSATAHQVGEAKLIEKGEPPKNLRNLGLFYYKCPKCGNSANSKRISEYVETHLQPDPIELEGELITEDLTETHDMANGLDSVANNEPETNTDGVSSVIETEQDKQQKAPFFTRECVLMGLAVFLFVAWLWHKLKPKVKPIEQPEKEATA